MVQVPKKSVLPILMIFKIKCKEHLCIMAIIMVSMSYYYVLRIPQHLKIFTTVHF